MPKHLRLSQADFSQLRKLNPRRIHGVYFFLTIYSASPSLPGPRIASVVGKKIAAKAVSRNAIERKFREVVRMHKKMLNPQYIYVFSAKKEVVGTSYKEMEGDILKLLERIASGGTIHST